VLDAPSPKLLSIARSLDTVLLIAFSLSLVRLTEAHLPLHLRVPVRVHCAGRDSEVAELCDELWINRPLRLDAVVHQVGIVLKAVASAAAGVVAVHDAHVEAIRGRKEHRNAERDAQMIINFWLLQ
jgi:hypothetical protein